MRCVVFLLFASCGWTIAAEPPVHLSGTVAEGREYKSEAGQGLLFSLEPDGSGWTIRISSKARCAVEHENWASVVTPPYRARNGLMIDTNYGVPAQEAVRETHAFSFVVNCEDYEREHARLDMVLWPYGHAPTEVDEAKAKLGTSRLGKGRLKIVDSKISSKELGRINWVKFEVELTFPD